MFFGGHNERGTKPDRLAEFPAAPFHEFETRLLHGGKRGDGLVELPLGQSPITRLDTPLHRHEGQAGASRHDQHHGSEKFESEAGRIAHWEAKSTRSRAPWTISTGRSYTCFSLTQAFKTNFPAGSPSSRYEPSGSVFWKWGVSR